MPVRAKVPALDVLRGAAREIGRAGGYRLIVLFGSAARPDARAADDVDLGALGHAPIDPIALTNRFIKVLGYQEVDITDLGRADPLLLVTVARDGVALYESQPGEFARFVSLAARRYADARKFRTAERSEINDFLAGRPPARD